MEGRSLRRERREDRPLRQDGREGRSLRMERREDRPLRQDRREGWSPRNDRRENNAYRDRRREDPYRREAGRHEFQAREGGKIAWHQFPSLGAAGNGRRGAAAPRNRA